MLDATSGARIRSAGGALTLVLACLAPWAFGSVDAWAELGLDVGVGLAAVLAVAAGPTSGPSWRRRLLCTPSVALGGLVLLALLQAAPLSDGILAWASPSMMTLRKEVLPDVPAHVLGDASRPIPRPTATLSQNPEAAIRAAARLARAWLLFQSVLALGGGFAAFRSLGAAMSANATLLGLFALIQALTWNGRIFWIRPSPNDAAWAGGGPFVCHSHLAEYLNVGLGFALGFLLAGDRGGAARDRGRRLWAAYAAGAIVVGIVTSNSRGGVLAMLAAGVATVGVQRLGNPRLLRPTRVLAGLVLTMALVATLLVILGDSAPYQGRLATILDRDDAGYSSRLEIWGAALRAWRGHPVWGTGLGSFPWATTPFFTRDTGHFYARAENEAVDLLVEGGLVGTALAAAAAAGITTLARRALAAAAPGDRALILGGIFGVLALAFQSLSDFGLHIPGVAVPAVILIAHLSRLGLAATAPSAASLTDSSRPMRRPGRLLAGAAVAIGATLLIVNGARGMRAESLLVKAGLPAPGAVMPTVVELTQSREDLERMQRALEGVLALRPDWAEGYLRLGQVHLALYERTAAEWLTDAALPEETPVDTLASPLWLLGVLHGAGTAGPPGTADWLEYEPIRRNLVPAARCFLEARRCCPVAALSHAGLASLAYLLQGEEAASIHAARALRLAGNDSKLTAYTALVAVQVGDFDLAARCWRRTLTAQGGGPDWEAIANTAGAVLPPDQILRAVIPDARGALRFAARLYAAPGQEATRDLFYREALARLPHEPGLSRAERLQLEACAWAGLDEPGRALPLMEQALGMRPRQFAWRSTLIGWMLRWGRLREAHDQALVWFHLAKGDAEARRTLEQTTARLASGDSGSGDSR
jgi:O-antigen ligase